MKKLYFAAVLLILFVRSSTAQFYALYFDGADSSFSNSFLVDLDKASSNVWQIGPPQKIIFDSASTLHNAIVTDTINFYPANDTSKFIIKVLNHMGPWGIFALQWKQKLDMDPSFDGGIIEYSTDRGKTWVNVFNNPYVYNFYGFQKENQDTLIGGEYALSGTDSTWRDIWLCLDISWLQQFQPDTIYFQFTLLSDSINNNKEGWMIDNFLVHITYLHIAIKETDHEDRLKVYPNPASDIVHIQTEWVMDYQIIEQMELVDPLGRVVEKWTNIPTKFWFDTRKYPDGRYALKVKTNIKSEDIQLEIRK